MNKLLSVLLALTTSQALAFAPAVDGSGDAFMSCSGYHHGSYLDFYSNRDGSEIYIEVSNDGEPDASGWPLYKVENVEKWGSTTVVVNAADYNKTFNDVAAAMTDKSGATVYDYVQVEATGPNSEKMVLNLNNFYGDSFLVLGNSVEPLTCQAIQH